MDSNVDIFIKSIGTAIIELLLFIPVLIISVFSIEYSENLFPVIRVILFVFPLSVFIIYLLFSNTKFISLSCYLLKYRLKAVNCMILRILISNLIFYSLLGIFFWLQLNNIRGLLINSIRVILLIEFGSCFLPKIRTRMSLFLLKIRWEKVITTKGGKQYGEDAKVPVTWIE